ncbi:MAG: class I SAM-dependent methyltransferase [Blautia massiliensis (ex Durand et al. 2017)]
MTDKNISVQLSMRLRAIAGMVTKGNRLADVGCDHGYLSIYLVGERIVPSAIAMDVRPGPLSRARENISRYGLEDYIETRLSDGLTKLEPGEGDTLVIAGMGGPLMERILKDGAKVREGFQELILQPQSDLPHFRHFLSEIGWEIVREEMIKEDGKFYPMMKAVRRQFGRKDCLHRGRGLVWTSPSEKVSSGPEGISSQGGNRSVRKYWPVFPGQSLFPQKARLAEVKEEMELIHTALKRYESI